MWLVVWSKSFGRLPIRQLYIVSLKNIISRFSYGFFFSKIAVQYTITGCIVHINRKQTSNQTSPMLILLLNFSLPWPISRRERVLESRDGADSIIFDSIYVLIYITDVEQVWHSKDKDVHDSVGFVLAMRLQSRNKSEAHLRSIMLIKKIQFFDTKRGFIVAGHQTALDHKNEFTAGDRAIRSSMILPRYEC